MIKILIADDSAFMRLAIDKMLSRDPDFTIVGFCNNGEEVLEKLETLKPDVLTLDIEMPKMSGLEVLGKIMATNPLPVIMVSSLTSAGTEETIRALELGAVDVVAKPGSFINLKITDIFAELSTKIKAAATAKVFKREKPEINSNKLRFISERIRGRAEQIARDINLKDYKPMIKVPDIEYKQNEEIKIINEFKPDLIIIGISTGGPVSLQKIIPELPHDLPCAVIVAQHMPAGFTRSLANRLNQTSPLEVKEAGDGDMIKPGMVLIAPAGFQTRVRKRYVGYCVQILDESEKSYLYKPSIDILFSSAAELYKNKVLGIIMTGMGNDGTKGAADIHRAGGKIYVQSEETCIVASMPNSIVKAGIADKIIPLDLIAKSITELF